jgi:sugar phosphate permease
MAFFNYADRQALSAVMPLLEKELHITKEQQGLLGTAFAYCYGLGAPFAGFIVDRVRRRSAVLWGLQVWSIICIGTGLARNFPQLLLLPRGRGPRRGRLLPRLHVPHQRLPRQGHALPRHGPPPDQRLRRHHPRLRLRRMDRRPVRLEMVLHHFGTLGVILGVVVRKLLVEPVRGATEVASAAAASARLTRADLSPSLLLAYAAFCAANFVAGVVLVWMPSYFHEKFGVNLAVGALSATAPIQIASMIAAPLGGWLADRWAARNNAGRMLVQMTGAFLAAPCVYLCATTSNYYVALAALAAWGAFKGIYDANIFATAYDVVRPGARGAAAGVMNMVGWLLGAAPAAWIVGRQADASGLGNAIASSAVAYALAGVFLLIGVLFFIQRDRAKMLATIGA